MILVVICSIVAGIHALQLADNAEMCDIMICTLYRMLIAVILCTCRHHDLQLADDAELCDLGVVHVRHGGRQVGQDEEVPGQHEGTQARQQEAVR